VNAKRIALAASLALSGAAYAAEPDPDFTCSLRHPAKSADSLTRLPQPVRFYIQNSRPKIGAMADRGAFYNATDVIVKPGPSNRFIRGGTIGDKYFLWYEHGGIAYWKTIVILTADAAGAPAVVAEQNGGFPDGLCAATDALVSRH
jgi:hypothetical protein